MATESQFSWRKILSFFGVALIVFVGIVTLAAGISLCVDHKAFYGVMTIISSIGTFAYAYFLYKDYNKYSAEMNNKKPTYTR